MAQTLKRWLGDRHHSTATAGSNPLTTPPNISRRVKNNEQPLLGSPFHFSSFSSGPSFRCDVNGESSPRSCSQSPPSTTSLEQPTRPLCTPIAEAEEIMSGQASYTPEEHAAAVSVALSGHEGILHV
jgi:hypothetical protein